MPLSFPSPLISPMFSFDILLLAYLKKPFLLSDTTAFSVNASQALAFLQADADYSSVFSPRSKALLPEVIYTLVQP